jgi:hypothetical protein
MTLSLQPPVRPEDARQPGDEIDALLRAYYRAEMPDPWPSFEAPLRQNVVPFRKPTRRFPLMRSRLAVAASVALIVGGMWFLSRMPHNSKPDATLPLGPGVGTKIKMHESLIQGKDGPTEFKIEVDGDPPPSK